MKLEDQGSVSIICNADKKLNNGITLSFIRKNNSIEVNTIKGSDKVQIAKDSFNSLDATKAISIAIDIHNDENPAHVLIWSGNSHYTEENALYNSEKKII